MSLTQRVVTQVETQASKIQSIPICPRQNPVLRITLTGPALVYTVLALIAGIQFIHPSLTCMLIAIAPLPWIINNDYENFLLLGPGGTPSTFAGYLKINFLRLFALSDPYKPAPCSESTYPKTGYCQWVRSWLPKREGPRPIIAGIAPQRQLNQTGSADMYHALRRAMERTATQQPEILLTGISCFEKKGLSLFALDPVNVTCNGEIFHVHDTDRSMHMNLHPDDARIVLEKGWGERHPLARGGWMSAYVPREFLMIYAPRNREELDIVCRVIEAALFWSTGERLTFEIEAEDLVDI